MSLPEQQSKFLPVTAELSEFELELELRNLRNARKLGEVESLEFHTCAFNLCVRLERPERALEHASAAHEFDASELTVNNLAVAHLRSNPLISIELLDAAVAEFGRTLALCTNLADANARAGRMDIAAETLLTAETLLESDNAEHHFRFAHACAVARYDEACVGYLARYASLTGAIPADKFRSIRDLEPVVFRRTPEVQACIDRIEKAGDGFVLALYEVSNENQDAVEDLIHDWFDDRFLVGQFDECNFILPLVNVARMSPELCLTLLAATLPARDKLSRRSDLAARVRDVLLDSLKDKQRVAEIMRHLA